MKIDYADIVLLNAELKRRDTRYRVSYKDDKTVCIEPPGECCLTEDLRQNTLQCIREYYQKKHISVRLFNDVLYFACEELPGKQGGA